MEYNDVASHFMECPAVACIKLTGGTFILSITSIHTVGKNIGLWFDKKHVNEYAQVIDKYLEWKKITTEWSDVVDKEISTVMTDISSVMGIRFAFAQEPKTCIFSSSIILSSS
jgi:hypothetical protein